MSRSQKVFEDFLRRLDPQSPSTDLTYKKIRQKLIRYFSWRRCHNPEDQADETIQRVHDKLLDEATDYIEKPYSYLYAVAKNVYNEYVRSAIREEGIAKGLQELWPVILDEHGDCRKRCLQNLTPKKMELIMEYYSSKEDRGELVRSLGMNISSLRVQIHRIKNELKDCYKECLKEVRDAK